MFVLELFFKSLFILGMARLLGAVHARAVPDAVLLLTALTLPWRAERRQTGYGNRYVAACAVAVLRRQRGDGISAVRLSAGGKETNGMKKAISGVGDRLFYFSMNRTPRVLGPQ